MVRLRHVRGFYLRNLIKIWKVLLIVLSIILVLILLLIKEILADLGVILGLSKYFAVV